MPQTLSSPTFHDDRPALHARKRLRGSDVITRAATVELLRREVGQNALEPATDVLSRQYSNCPATALYLRAATSPAMTGVATWASELVEVSMLDFLQNEMPTSAFAQLSTRVLTVPPTGLVKVPSRSSPLTLQGGWVSEGGAKPVVSILLSSVTVSPYQLSAISTFSEEMVASTMIEAFVRQAIGHDLGGLLDSALLDSTAASSTRPAGLFNGVTPIAASPATPSAAEAMFADLAALGASVSSGHPDAKIIYIANPRQALRLQFAAPQYGGVVISGYMPAGSVAAIDADALVLLVGQPRFKLSRDAALNMESVPLPLAGAGATVIASPTSSMFQQDIVALRCTLLASWAKRRSGAAAIIAGPVSW